MIKICRLGLVTSLVCAFVLAAQSTAGAATVPFPAVPSTGLPVIGGLIDSLVGIATGTAYGAAGAVLAVLRSLGLPV
jgi:hypothetical protein